ncbi:MAG: alpha/beta hydrolase [Lentisphaeria bacterium]|nr:alpha/beta hydrolase [Lentisphaeria bacterium]
MLTRKYIQLNMSEDDSLKISYLEQTPNTESPRGEASSGECFLLLHGFAEYSVEFEALLQQLDPTWHCYCLDFKGFGYSEYDDLESMSLYDQTEVAEQFIEQLNLNNVNLIGHSMGGTVAALLTIHEGAEHRIRSLTIISGIGLVGTPPEIIQLIAGNTERSPLVRFKNPEVFYYRFLHDIFFDENKITDQLLSALAAPLQYENAYAPLLAAARQFALPESNRLRLDLKLLTLPCLIIWGENDQVTAAATAGLWRSNLKNSTLKILPNCGHSPHGEQPEECAKLLAEFIHKSTSQSPGGNNAAPSPEKIAPRKKYIPKMSKLFDKWNFSNAMLFLILKFLQLLKKFGVRAEENGWRKATGIFLRSEYSKFMLGVFHLDYARELGEITECSQAEAVVIDKLSAFLQRESCFHWAVKPGILWLGRQRTFFTDIVRAYYDENGDLLKLVPSFDNSRESFPLLTNQEIDSALNKVVSEYNSLRKRSSRQLPNLLSQRLMRYVKHHPDFRAARHGEFKLLIERIMTATVIHFEVMPETTSIEQLKYRFATPDIRIFKHPGWGLLNIICRFTANLSECDLWVQYHHVPVDGLPMQEQLEQLKHEWGVKGELIYPALNSEAAKTELFRYDGRLFRARIYADFTNFLRVRSLVNKRWRNQMNGPATIAGMVLWGLSRHQFFRERKMLFPVDTSPRVDKTVERELGLIFIRPGKFNDSNSSVNSFIQFQREFNIRLEQTRHGECESYEFLELCAMNHPIVYHLARLLFPDALSEIVGTVGLSIIKNAEMFICPLTDFQVNGFIAMGDLTIKTADGGRAGAVSVCGSRKQVRYYIEAIHAMCEDYGNLIGGEIAELGKQK